MHVVPTLPLKLTPPCLELTIFLLTCLSFTPAIGIFSHKGLPFLVTKAFLLVLKFTY